MLAFEVAVFEKSGDAYVAVLGNGEIDEVEVFYKAETEIAANDINEIINLYFYTAKYAFELEDYARKTLNWAQSNESWYTH